MKRLALMLLLATNAFAQVDLALEMTVAGQSEKLVVQQSEKGEWSVTKTTNALNRTDKSVGRYTLSAALVKPLQAKLTEVAKQVQNTEKVLTEAGGLKKKEEGNDGDDNMHAPIVRMNGRTFKSSAPFYTELLAIMQEFGKLPAQMVEGVSVDEKAELFQFWKEGKKSGTEKFVPGVYCNGVSPNLRCQARGNGIIYL